MDRAREQLTRPLQAGIAEDLAGRVFEEPLDLAGAQLPNLDLRGAHFKQLVNLRGASFQGMAWFQDAVFEGPLDLSGVMFANDARFDGTQFRRSATFSRAQFNGVPCFDRAVFYEAAFLDRMFCSGSFSLQQVRFEAAVTFRDTECYGGVWADRAVFRGSLEARGMRIYGRCLFPGGTSFRDRERNVCDATGTRAIG
jgi:uncharacterized protein YjbI with pentapeptide repeats